MTYLLHVDERLSQVVVESVGVSFFVALHGTDGHDYAVFVDAIATPVPVKLEKKSQIQSIKHTLGFHKHLCLRFRFTKRRLMV